jgi:hypothetical protein
MYPGWATASVIPFIDILVFKILALGGQRLLPCSASVMVLRPDSNEYVSRVAFQEVAKPFWARPTAPTI